MIADQPPALTGVSLQYVREHQESAAEPGTARISMQSHRLVEKRTRLALRVANRVLRFRSEPTNACTASSVGSTPRDGWREPPCAGSLPGCVKQAVSRDGRRSPYPGDDLLRFTADKFSDDSAVSRESLRRRLTCGSGDACRCGPIKHSACQTGTEAAGAGRFGDIARAFASENPAFQLVLRARIYGVNQILATASPKYVAAACSNYKSPAAIG